MMMHRVHQYISTGREYIIPMSAHTQFLHYMHNCLQYFGDRFDWQSLCTEKSLSWQIHKNNIEKSENIYHNQTKLVCRDF